MVDGHEYPEPVRRLLGETLAAAALLANTIKVDGTLTVQASGNGPLSVVMAECADRDSLRGIARLRRRVDDGTPPGSPVGTELLGEGVLTITIRPPRSAPYQGIVPLDGGTIARTVEGYFERSEQIRTRLWLSAASGAAAGMLIQALPEEARRARRERGEREEDWNRITTLADTVTPDELREVPNERLLGRLFHEERVHVQLPSALAFCCTCSRARTREALRSLPRTELEEILHEDGVITMDCQFCGASYRFDPIDVELLDREPAPEPGPEQ